MSEDPFYVKHTIVYFKHFFNYKRNITGFLQRIFGITLIVVQAQGLIIVMFIFS